VALIDGPGRRSVEPVVDRVADGIRSLQPRVEVTLDEVPAPTRLATYALAFSADVDDQAGGEVGSGRLVLLHEPEGNEAWDGVFRVVTFVRATVEPDVAGDPLLPAVGWSWLLEALDSHALLARAVGGTVTRVSNESFGALSAQPSSAEVEIRASWTPVVEGDLAAGLVDHARAWLDLLCTAAGLAPLPDGVVALPRQRPGR
jgi:hypothetical protein